MLQLDQTGSVCIPRQDLIISVVICDYKLINWPSYEYLLCDFSVHDIRSKQSDVVRASPTYFTSFPIPNHAIRVDFVVFRWLKKTSCADFQQTLLTGLAGGGSENYLAGIFFVPAATCFCHQSFKGIPATTLVLILEVWALSWLRCEPFLSTSAYMGLSIFLIALALFPLCNNFSNNLALHPRYDMNSSWMLL